MHIFLSGVILITLFSTGCASKQQTAAPIPEPKPAPATTETTTLLLPASNNIEHEIANAEVMELWQSAETARQAGDYATAITQLERALRLLPEDPIMWSRLAELHVRAGNAGQAENMATKSNMLTTDNPLLSYRNWLIIAQARRLQGDTTGASQAQAVADKLKSQVR